MISEIKNNLDFLKEIEKFKSIKRTLYNSNNLNENDAEHSWHLAMFILVFENKLPSSLNINKMLKMALIHDLAEIETGDIFRYDVKSNEEKNDKKEKELTAMKYLIKNLSSDLQDTILNLFVEYEENKSLEAKYVRAFDKVQPILQNICSNGKSWKEHNITRKKIVKHKLNDVNFDSLTLEIFNLLLEEGEEKKLI